MYFDITGNVVVRDSSQLVSWGRTPITGIGITDSVTGLHIGATNQNPLADTNDQMGWGIAWLLADTSAGNGASMVLEYGNTTRSSFWSTGTIPSSDNTAQPATLKPNAKVVPATGPQVRYPPRYSQRHAQ